LEQANHTGEPYARENLAKKRKRDALANKAKDRAMTARSQTQDGHNGRFTMPIQALHRETSAEALKPKKT